MISPFIQPMVFFTYLWKQDLNKDGYSILTLCFRLILLLLPVSCVSPIEVWSQLLLVHVKKPSCHGKSTWFVLYDLRWNYACRFWHFHCVWAFFFLSCGYVYIHIWWHLEYDEERILCLYAQISVQSIEQVFQRSGLVHLIGHTARTHTHTNTQSLMVSLRPGQSHMEQTVMRKRITVFHQQLSPAAPVSVKSTYIASGHAVAKEVLVSKQELAGKHP